MYSENSFLFDPYENSIRLSYYGLQHYYSLFALLLHRSMAWKNSNAMSVETTYLPAFASLMFVALPLLCCAQKNVPTSRSVLLSLTLSQAAET